MKPQTHDNGIQYLFVLFILSCFLLTLLIQGCSQPPRLVPEPAPAPSSSIPAPDAPTTPTTRTAPSTSILAQLKLSDAPALNKEIEVVATFALRESYVGDAENVTARILIPEKFKLVASDLKSYEETIPFARIPAESVEENAILIQSELDRGSILTEDPVTGDAIFSKKYTIVEWKGDIIPGESVEIKATIKAVKITTDWERIEARAGYWAGPGSYDGGDDVIYVRVYEDHAEISKMPPVSPEHINNPSNVDESPTPTPRPSPSETSKSGTKEFRNSLTITGSFKCYVSEDAVPSPGTPRSDNLTPMVWGGVYVHNAAK